MNEFEVLKKAVCTVLQVYDSEVTPDVTFEKALGADSIDLAQIFQLCEDALKVNLEDVDLQKIVTVRDAVDVLKKAVEKKNELG